MILELPVPAGQRRALPGHRQDGGAGTEVACLDSSRKTSRTIGLTQEGEYTEESGAASRPRRPRARRTRGGVGRDAYRTWI